MLSFFKHIYNLFDYESRNEIYGSKLGGAANEFESVIEKDEPPNEESEENADILDVSACHQKFGVITALHANGGVIDHVTLFTCDVASIFHEFKVGAKVKYLNYKQPDSDFVKVVKVELFENCWEDQTEEDIQKSIQELKGTQTKTFNTHQRSLVGQIMSRNGRFLVVDTDHKEVTVDLDNIVIEFIPKEGDRVYLECNVQTDEDFADLSGEVLEVKKVHASRTKKIDGVVTQVHGEWGVINSDCYYTEDILQNGLHLKKGDNVNCEVIECERGIFHWRCLKLELINTTAVIVHPTPSQQKKETVKVITITEDVCFTLSKLSEDQQLEMEITNNSERPHTVQRIEIAGTRRNSQLKIDKIIVPIVIEPKQTKTIIVECSSKFYGMSKEKLVFVFDNFKIFRTIEVLVGIGKEDENKNVDKKFNFRRNPSRFQAHTVLVNKTAGVPGVRPFQSCRFISQRIPSYDLPKPLRDALLTNVVRANQIRSVENLYPCLAKGLNFYNYSQRFEILLFVEEIEQFVIFRQYDMERGHFTREGEYLVLTIENLAEKRPSLVIGDTVRAITCFGDPKSSKLPHDGCIHKVLFDRILIKFNPSFHNSYNGEDYKLEFYFSRFCFRKQHFAAEKIVKLRDENFLFPSRIVLSEKLQLDADLDDSGRLLVDGKVTDNQWYNENLNVIQKSAIKNILRGEARSMPYIVFGPPGTGKTVTLVETIIQIAKNLPNSRILVGSPTNSAADLITTRLIESEALNPGEFVRLVSQRVLERELIPEHLKPFCATIDISEDNSAEDRMITTEKGLKLKCQIRYLGRHKVTIGTCLTLGNFLQMNFPKEHFTHLLIDECGQCNEPELMTPMCLLGKNFGQVILAGDPYQLGPIVVNSYAVDRGFGISFLERLAERVPYMRDKIRFPDTGRDQRLVTKLIYSYRALPSILDTYNELFYDSELMPMIAPTGTKEFELLQRLQPLLPSSKTRSPSHGAFFHGIVGLNQQDDDSPSWYNISEASHIVAFISLLFSFNVSPDQIGVITPYQKQVKIIRRMLTENGSDIPKIGTIEEFQGQEREIILISTVRSAKNLLGVDAKFSLGFACSTKRMNVAISRPRSLLYICGNPHVLSLTDKWRDLIRACVENDAYIGCDLPDCIQTEFPSKS